MNLWDNGKKEVEMCIPGESYHPKMHKDVVHVQDQSRSRASMVAHP